MRITPFRAVQCLAVIVIVAMAGMQLYFLANATSMGTSSARCVMALGVLPVCVFVMWWVGGWVGDVMCCAACVVAFAVVQPVPSLPYVEPTSETNPSTAARIASAAFNNANPNSVNTAADEWGDGNLRAPTKGAAASAHSQRTAERTTERTAAAGGGVPSAAGAGADNNAVVPAQRSGGVPAPTGAAVAGGGVPAAKSSVSLSAASTNTNTNTNTNTDMKPVAGGGVPKAATGDAVPVAGGGVPAAPTPAAAAAAAATNTPLAAPTSAPRTRVGRVGEAAAAAAEAEAEDDGDEPETGLAPTAPTRASKRFAKQLAAVHTWLQGDVPEGSIRDFVRSGGRFPIAVLTCNRPDMLRNTLRSLLQVRGVDKSMLFVVQDGNFAPVKDVVQQFGLKLKQSNGE